jgi:hypothetical protein
LHFRAKPVNQQLRFSESGFTVAGFECDAHAGKRDLKLMELSSDSLHRQTLRRPRLAKDRGAASGQHPASYRVRARAFDVFARVLAEVHGEPGGLVA